MGARKAKGSFVQPGTNPGKAVHLMSIHAEVGMQCADCHYEQDSHGNGLIYGEVANLRSRSAARTATARPMPIPRCAPAALPRRPKATTWPCCAIPTASAGSNGSKAMMAAAS